MSKAEMFVLALLVAGGGYYLYTQMEEKAVPPGVPPGSNPFPVVKPDGSKTEAWLNFAGQLVDQAGNLITHFTNSGEVNGTYFMSEFPEGTMYLGNDYNYVLVPEEFLMRRGVFNYNGVEVQMAQSNRPMVVG
jgi:hypothetical protein